MKCECPVFSTCLLSSYCKTNAFQYMCLPKTEVFNKGQQIILKENLLTYVVLSGIGKVTVSAGTNDIFDLFLLGMGQIYGEMLPFIVDRIQSEFWAVNTLSVCKISALGLREYAKQNPMVFYDLLKASGNNYTSSVQIRWIMSPLTVSTRALRLLIVLNEMNGKDSEISISITHDEIAQILRTDRTSVSLGLEKLRDDGLIEMGYRKIHLLDSVVLKKLQKELELVCPKVAYSVLQ